ncbi:MAG: AzlD domain-containing protein [Clostridia bacterium]|jgi:branched-subunit amino acid transport protein AzlD|nr:AzlD domain-containing protein [Clostridia bacterium]
MKSMYPFLAIAVAAACTFATRLVPFVIFGGKKEVPDAVNKLGKILPAAIIAILIIYCLKDVSFVSGNHGAPEIIAILVTAILHIWKRNSLLSIGCGTVCYMFLVQHVFA